MNARRRNRQAAHAGRRRHRDQLRAVTRRVLERIVEAAAHVTGAKYAALGVIDHAGTGLERFVTYGVTPETQTEIGDPPHGRGILGVLIREARPLRLHDISEDPRSVGFPPGHPPMKTFLGVPIRLRGVAYGNLYLTEKEGGSDFVDEDEELVTLLAAQAAVAIENARLYQSATTWSQQLESLNEIGELSSASCSSSRCSTSLHDGCGSSSTPGSSRSRFRAETTLRVAAADGEGAAALEAVESLGRRLEDRARTEPRSERARRRAARGSRGRPGGHEASSGIERAVRAAARPRPRDRGPRRTRQDRAGSTLQRRRSQARGAVRHARGRRSRPVTTRCARRPHGASSPDRSSSAVASRASFTTRPGRR